MAVLAPGNIDLKRRPRVKNADGSISTVRSIGVNIDGREVLIPTVSDDGRIMSDDEAVATFKRTGKHLGMFDTPEASTAYAEQLHQEQEAMVSQGDPLKTFLDKSPLTTSQRADLWDAFEESGDTDALVQRLNGLKVPNEVKAKLWDMKASSADRPEQPEAKTPVVSEEPEGKSFGQHVKEGVEGAASMLNPVTMAKGIGQMVMHPLDTIDAMRDASADQWGKAGAALQEGPADSVSEGIVRAVTGGALSPAQLKAAGHAAAAVIPLVGPAAAHAGEEIEKGNYGRGIGEGVGMLVAPKVTNTAVKAGVGAARKVAAPLASKVNPTVAAAAERTGVEMPASALSESKVVPLAEALAAKGPGGGAAAARFESAVTTLSNKADDVAREASKYTDDLERGRVIAQGFDDYKTNWEQTKSALYKEAEIPSKIKFFTKADDVVKFIDDVLAEKRAASRHVGKLAPEEAALTNLRNALTKGNRGGRAPKDIQVRDLRAIKRQFVDPNTDFKAPVATGDAAVYRKIGAMMDDQVDVAIQRADPQLYAKIERAKAVYKDGLGKIDSVYGEQISKLAGQERYDLIVKNVANARMSAADIPRIIEVAGAEGADAMRASVIANLVSKAKGQGGANLTPQGLSRAMNTFGRDKLQALLTEEQFQKLNDVASLSRSLEKGTKVMGGSQTMFGARLMAYPAAMLTNPAATLMTLLGDAAASRFLASRFGQRWMTTGFMPLTGATGDFIAKTAREVARPGATTAQMPPAKPRPVYPRAADQENEDSPRNRVATR